MEVFVSGYQLLDMHCIVLPVKIDGGVSISFLRKKQLSEKKKKKKEVGMTTWRRSFKTASGI
jgi:hypothetical protein